ncbi:MAG: hypothetical protein QGG58_11500, partial [Chloroflexota bacterium]|nr:hypothetical protein [Chloroflexota bacterium]
MSRQGTTLLIFGASGDLTSRKLIPSLFSLFCKGRLPEDVAIVGTSRTQMTDDEWRERLQAGLPGEVVEEHWSNFAPRVHYVPADATDPAAFADLNAGLIRAAGGDQGNRLYYLATAPRFFAPIVENLGAAGMVDHGETWSRLVPTQLAGCQAPGQIRKLSGTGHLLVVWTQQSEAEVRQGF